MAAQLVTVLKVAGAAGDVVWQRLHGWAAQRQAGPGGEWSPQQFPPEVRREADRLADVLRAHPTAPPVVHFGEWADLWSTGDLFHRGGTRGGGPFAVRVHGERYELFGHLLPDGGALAESLSGAGPHQYPETGWYILRLREALESWEGLVDRAVILVLRRVVTSSVTDEEIVASQQSVPAWMAEENRGR